MVQNKLMKTALAFEFVFLRFAFLFFFLIVISVTVDSVLMVCFFLYFILVHKMAIFEDKKKTTNDENSFLKRK